MKKVRLKAVWYTVYKHMLHPDRLTFGVATCIQVYGIFTIGFHPGQTFSHAAVEWRGSDGTWNTNGHCKLGFGRNLRIKK